MLGCPLGKVLEWGLFHGSNVFPEKVKAALWCKIDKNLLKAPKNVVLCCDFKMELTADVLFKVFQN